MLGVMEDKEISKIWFWFWEFIYLLGGRRIYYFIIGEIEKLET